MRIDRSHVLFSKYSIVLLTSLIVLYADCGVQDKSNAENSVQSSFIKYYGDTSSARGVTVEETTDGGYILTGYSTGGEHGAEDAYLIKTDSNGNRIWTKYYGGSGKDYGWAVRQTPDSGFIIVGYTDSFGKGGMDIYLIKTDQEGDTLWTKTMGGTGDEYGWDIRITDDQGYIIAAQTDKDGKGNIDAFLLKLDENGNEIWSRSYGGNKIDRIFSVQQTADGGFISAGITYSFSSINEQDRDGYLLKTSATGNEEWYKIFGGDDYDVCHSVALTNDGGFFIAGYGESYATFGYRDMYLIKTDKDGNKEWLKVYGGSGEERGIKGYQTNDSGYIAIGFTAENRDICLVKTNSVGDSLWTRNMGNPNEVEFGYTVRETKNNELILIGHAEPLNREYSRILLIKTNDEGIVNQNNEMFNSALKNE